MGLNHEKAQDLVTYVTTTCGNEPYWDVECCIWIIQYLTATKEPSFLDCYSKCDNKYILKNVLSLKLYSLYVLLIASPLEKIPPHINGKPIVKAITAWRFKQGE
jgi:hypothetical protein